MVRTEQQQGVVTPQLPTPPATVSPEASPGVPNTGSAIATLLIKEGYLTADQKVTTIRDAIVRLGARQVTNVVTVVTQSQQYRTKDKTMAAYMQTLWKHALGCALGTKWFADKTDYKELAQEGLMAGLLHDIGQLFLLKVL